MRIFLNEELWGVLRKMTLCLLCCRRLQLQGYIAAMSGVFVSTHETEVSVGRDAVSVNIPEPKGCIEYQQAVQDAVNVNNTQGYIGILGKLK